MSSKFIFTYTLCRVFVGWVFSKSLLPSFHCKVSPVSSALNQFWHLCIRTLSSEITLNPHGYWGLSRLTPAIGVARNWKPPNAFLVSFSHWLLKNCRKITDVTYFLAFLVYKKGNFQPLKIDKVWKITLWVEDKMDHPGKQITY